MHRLAGALCIVALVSVPRADDDGRRGHTGEGPDERKSLQPPAVTDIDEGQITILAVPHKRIRYVVGQAERLDHPNESFDIVVFAWAL